MDVEEEPEYARREQISTLLSHRCECGVTRDRRAAARVGQAVHVAVERFAAVGETIADDNPDIRRDMYDACKEAREAGSGIERLMTTCGEGAAARGSTVRAARALLAAVTRVLLLADIVVVKQLLLAKDKVSRTLGRLESVATFAEFVRAFAAFGGEMVELARLTAERRADLRDERRRAQMAAARHVLERSTIMLLTSSKTCLRHPDCASARENRDTVFCQMRRAMDLVHYVVKDGVLDCQASVRSDEACEWECGAGTARAALRRLVALATDAGGGARAPSPARRDALARALQQLVERTHDFTDSPYTGHKHRRRILDLCEQIASDVDRVLEVALAMERAGESVGSGARGALQGACEDTTCGARALAAALTAAARAQAEDLAAVAASARAAAADLAVIASSQRRMRASSCGEREPERLHSVAARLHEHLDHILEVCKLLRHVAMTESLQVSAKFAEINLRIYGPQVVTAARALVAHPSSREAHDNLHVFTDTWQWLLEDVTTLARDVLQLTAGKPDKQVYMSLPRPGKHGTTSKPLKAVRLDPNEQAKIAKSGLEMKMMSSEMDAETDKWQESGAALEENNDIVKRAKAMSSMAFSMYQFTKGEGRIATTQDLFTQAEYFAEEANEMYKVVRQFSYQVPAGTTKKELLALLDRVPTFVQQLQFTVKEPTVGRAATFCKVDNVIQETKNLMNVVSKLVTTCFDCANKGLIPLSKAINKTSSINSRDDPYKLDFTALAGGGGRGAGGTGGGGRDDEAAGGGGAEGKGGGGTSDTAM